MAAVGRGVTRQTFDEVMVPVFAPASFIPVRGKGLEVWDQEGRRYLDLSAGIAVLALGHTPDAIVEALTEQAKKLWHISNYFTIFCAGGLLVSIPITALFMSLQKYYVEGVTGGAVKG